LSTGLNRCVSRGEERGDDSMRDAKLAGKRVVEVYNRIAPIYDAWAWLTETKARNRCLELAAIRDGEDVLEVAVGTGLAFARILEANPSGRNEGVDLSPGMLARAENRAVRTGTRNYRLTVGDARSLDFPSDSFDVLTSNYMFDLLPESDFLRVVEEFRRVLRPGGRLAVANMAEGKKWYNGMWDVVYRINPALLGGCRAVSLLPWLERCGFVRARTEYISQFTFPSEVVFGVAP